MKNVITCKHIVGSKWHFADDVTFSHDKLVSYLSDLKLCNNLDLSAHKNAKSLHLLKINKV